MKRHPYVARPRSRLTYQLTYALRHPKKVWPHLRRLARDAKLRSTTRDHVSYYREVMRADIRDMTADGAIGSHRRASWLRVGRMQFDYLVKHGLTPQDRVLDIGCGNLRLGWRLVEHLETGNYYGVDISPEILMAAADTVTEHGLQAKLPHLSLVKDLTFASLPDAHFTVIHAHSVFSHNPIDVIDECLRHVGRILHPDGFFDFTFDRTEKAEHHVLREDFYYRTETLIGLAEQHGLKAEFMGDWERSRHKQSKLRVTHPR
ncbi:class I SAM-dependent methyltransferase [Planotetraspora kaengkrachanensis]|uniref:Methyltransferase n=1 Tax=Planotetraspora kaengkrachanensis TaxID=575193 RepID=A0A8J3VAK7_9ACTN|nr:class I SAM-dependent methyltransferase [Planotetraspora kaengkrachanensis]GIG83308.1 methyltransferase [Planotetraspora kaengkrachanensis]